MISISNMFGTVIMSIASIGLGYVPKSMGLSHELWSTENKLFEYVPCPDEYEKIPAAQINVFSLPEKNFQGAFSSLDDFFAANPELLPETSLVGYCTIVIYFLTNRACHVIEDAETFKQEYEKRGRNYDGLKSDVSTIHDPYLAENEVIFFAAAGLQNPRKIIITRPFYGSQAKISECHLPYEKIPSDK
jgi:hypothetical protein